MISTRGFSSRSIRLLVRQTLLAALATSSAFATGYYGPSVYLNDGGRRVAASPEFYWDLEVKRLSSNFHPKEKFVGEPGFSMSGEWSRAEREKPLIERTAKADLDDFAAALRAGRIKPPDPAQASAQHEAARAAINSSAKTLPDEFPSEFADYHRGAIASTPEEACKIWERLLARPAEERHFRSVWAAFMVGKRFLKEGNPEASAWFQRTRELAQQGFNDSLGMAADSYGWEARSEWKQGHPEKAAPLFLTQLSLGDESAVISLKALIPDREPVEGMLNYGPESEEQQKWDEATRKAYDEKVLRELKNAARDPLRRRLVTLHILAVQSEPYFAEDMGRPAVNRAARWLNAIEEAHPGKIDDAEYLGWIAYGDGKYDQATRWLAFSDGQTPAALWLKSKLQRRAGKLDEALRTMAQAWETLRDRAAYSGWKPAQELEDGEHFSGEGDHWSFEDSASGDLGALRLARSEFVGALDVLAKAKMWSDAAFVAERVLTLDELKKYVDALPAAVPKEHDANDPAEKLRYLLGRRLVREDRYAEAAPYLPPRYAERLQAYVNALNDGASSKLSKAERARAYFKAAWMARYDGMELMGTEGAPDGFISEGNFPEPDLAKERESGTYIKTSYDNSGEHETHVPATLKANAEDKARLTKQKIRPDVRFHYRVIAAALALRAAELLPDNSAELADVLNYGGRWAQDRDQKMADRCYLLLKQRGAKTEIGRAAMAKRWFVDQNGPWSSEEQAAQGPENKPEE
ncbi:MAG: hypothetical protein ACXWAX_05725 [Chthoniobacterales bacterium]